MMQPIASITRRQLAQVLGACFGGSALAGLPGLQAIAQSRKETLVVGIDISDTSSLDPARDLHYTPPMTISACYDTLVSMAPGNYIDLKPLLATRWARTPDGRGWRFNLRENVKFATGAAMTADDVKFSLDRVRYIRTQAAEYLENVEHVDVVDAATVDIVLKDPTQPLVATLAAPSFVVTDRKAVRDHGGLATLEASTHDSATAWLNQNSAGTGAYKLARWERNASIELAANPFSWRGMPAFKRVIIQHFADGAAQLLALRQGDIDIAFNLLPEQIKTIKQDGDIRIAPEVSLDSIYLALTNSSDFNSALANKKVRQAVGASIDYDGIKDFLLGGASMRPPSFIPVGLLGSTEEMTRDFGFKQDLDKARRLLKEAGYPDGFEFEVIYGNGSIAGSSYNVIAQMLQSDLARVGIKLNLRPLPAVNVRTLYSTGKFQSVLTYWNPPAVENSLWGYATVQRVAKRLHWTPPQDLVSLVDKASAETDKAKKAQLWEEYQRRMVDEAHLIVLSQPIYQIGVRKELRPIPLTGAGWQLDIADVKPA